MKKISILVLCLVFGLCCAEENKVKMYVEGDFRYIESNGIPKHKTGEFPNRRNPNAISGQKHKFKIPLKPSKKKSNSRNSNRPEPRMVFAVALNGVPFEPGTAETWNGDRSWRYEALTGKLNLGTDSSNAHVQPGGSYHYHGLPKGLVEKLRKKKKNKNKNKDKTD